MEIPLLSNLIHLQAENLALLYTTQLEELVSANTEHKSNNAITQ